MKNHFNIAMIALLLAVVLPSSDAEGQINMRSLLEQILQNSAPNGGRQQFPQQPPVVRQAPLIIKTPVRQSPQVLPRGSYPAPQPIAVQDYILTTGGVENKATCDGNNLTIYSDGVGHRYDRRPELDSSDGQFLGFCNQRLDKNIRFPVDGGNRMQVAGPRGQWMWSQMKVKKTIALIPVNQPGAGDLHARIDRLAFKIQEQSRQLAAAANTHCQHSPHYGHLVADTSAMLKQSMHMHEVAHDHGDIKHLRADLASLDKSFHHLEDTFGRVASDARQGRGSGHPARVKQLLKDTGSNIHVLSDIIVTVDLPTQNGPPFGTFGNIDQLTHQLEEATNGLLLDMHYNYSHNPQFAKTYEETYCLLTAAQQVREAAHKNKQGKIKRSLKGMDVVARKLAGDLRKWNCQARYRCGNGSLMQKLATVQWNLADLMHDAGVAPTELMFLPGRNLTVAPLNVAPRPR